MSRLWSESSTRSLVKSYSTARIQNSSQSLSFPVFLRTFLIVCSNMEKGHFHVLIGSLSETQKQNHNKTLKEAPPMFIEEMLKDTRHSKKKKKKHLLSVQIRTFCLINICRQESTFDTQVQTLYYDISCGLFWGEKDLLLWKPGIWTSVGTQAQTN